MSNVFQKKASEKNEQIAQAAVSGKLAALGY
jgi:hypothetical protein